ncbi:MAG: hypothetical protein QNJ97_05045 [Myxococcota bacterium]|nr:hypothetical protein [Myxococcota bacterium]
MQIGNIRYKTLDTETLVDVRALPPGRADRRFISSSRRRTKPTAGFIVSLPSTFSIGAVIELDLAFPDQPFTYRARGMVSWVQDGASQDHCRTGVIVLAMEKLDPSGVPISEPPVEPAVGSGHIRPSSPPDLSMPPPGITVPNDAPAIDPMPDQSVAGEIEMPVSGAAAVEENAASDINAPAQVGVGPPLPRPENISELLTNLVDSEVSVQEDSAPLSIEDIAVLGDFLDSDQKIVAMCGLDCDLANWLGAALAMVPKAVAQKDALAKTVSAETVSNLKEIFNISTSVFERQDPPPSFGTLFLLLQDEVPYAHRALLENVGERVNFIIDVPGYGSGRLCYVRSTGDPLPPSDVEIESNEISLPPREPPTSNSDSPSPPADADAPDKAEKPPAHPPLIDPTAFATTLTNLVGEDVAVQVASDNQMNTDDMAVIGDYTSGGDAAALCVLDIALTNWLSAALSSTPKITAQKDIKSKTISDETTENAAQAMGILASVFDSPDQASHALGAVRFPVKGDELPEDMNALLSAPQAATCYDVEIPEYGSGRVLYVKLDL